MRALRPCKYTKKKALLDKREDFENLFAQLTREHIKILEIFAWHEAVTSSFTRNFSRSIENKDPQIDR